MIHVALFLSLVTTDGKIAADNLDAQLAGYQKAGPQHRPKVIELLLMRAQFFGRPDDLAAAEKLARTLPADGLLLKARVAAALHRFPEALQLCAQAEKRGANVDVVRAGIQQAMGDEDLALPLRERVARERPDLESLGQLAVLYAQLGRPSDELFARALASYRDVSPFPVAWLDFQQGLVEERAGRLASARERYEAAHERLPAYAAATGHLAGVLAQLGEKQRAIRLLQALPPDDPEYAAQLLALRPDPQLRAAVEKRYQQLLRQFPEAYADHAARFYLGQLKAIELAQKNLKLRHTDEAHQLLIEARLAAGRDACPAADAALEQRRGAALRVAAARAYHACGRDPTIALPAPSPPPATPRR